MHQNASIQHQKLTNFLGRGQTPLPRPFLWWGRKLLPRPHPSSAPSCYASEQESS